LDLEKVNLEKVEIPKKLEKNLENLEIEEILPSWWQESELWELVNFWDNVWNYLKIGNLEKSETELENKLKPQIELKTVFENIIIKLLPSWQNLKNLQKQQAEILRNIIKIKKEIDKISEIIKTNLINNLDKKRNQNQKKSESYSLSQPKIQPEVGQNLKTKTKTGNLENKAKTELEKKTSNSEIQNLENLKNLQNLEGFLANLEVEGRRTEQEIDEINQQIKLFQEQITDFWTKFENNSQTKIPKFLANSQIQLFLLIFWLSLEVSLEVVISQPARINRNKIIANPVSFWARNNELKLETPNKLNLETENWENYSLDMGIVASFGQILSSKILQTPTFGLINWHPSKLPKYRGCTPIQSAIANGDDKTALSWIKMSPKMDAGVIWLQLETEIKKTDNFETIADGMGKLGAQTWSLPIVATIFEDLWGLDLS